VGRGRSCICAALRTTQQLLNMRYTFTRDPHREASKHRALNKQRSTAEHSKCGRSVLLHVPAQSPCAHCPLCGLAEHLVVPLDIQRKRIRDGHTILGHLQHTHTAGESGKTAYKPRVRTTSSVGQGHAQIVLSVVCGPVCGWLQTPAFITAQSTLVGAAKVNRHPC
jgi:hypothetical protein